GLGGFATPVQRTDVALKMKLTPHVNEHNMIRLEVDQEIQDILSPNFRDLLKSNLNQKKRKSTENFV
ncbi:MAG: hypothetical protein ACXW06_05855, partial [Halobacteriota archaeon]